MRIDTDNRLLVPLLRLVDACIDLERLEASDDLFDSFDEDGEEDREVGRTLREFRDALAVARLAIKEEVRA